MSKARLAIDELIFEISSAQQKVIRSGVSGQRVIVLRTREISVPEYSKIDLESQSQVISNLDEVTCFG